MMNQRSSLPHRQEWECLCHLGSREWSCACLLCRIVVSWPVVVSVIMEKLVEERPIMYESLPLVLGAVVPVLLRAVDRVGGPVVLDNFRMIDRDVGRPLVEVVDRIAAFTHDVGQKPVRVVQRGRGTVDESGLHLSPAMRIRP